MKMFRAAMVFVLIQSAAFKEIKDIKHLKKLYETNLNSSKKQDKEDRVLMRTWTVDFQVKRVNVTTKHRLQMIRHKEHSFKIIDYNVKWIECIFLHRWLIRKLEKEYYADESECLTTTGEDKTNAVDQVAKQCRKWRKGYRYLVNTCKTDNAGDEEAADLCLIQYMKADNYNKVIQRLLVLKLEAMKKLYLQLSESLKDLEECLKTKLSIYLEKVRTTMDTLNKCYSLTTQDDHSDIENI